MMSKQWVRTAAAAAMLAGSSATMAEFSGNVAVVSDYLFDGVSQTDNKPAVQVGLDYALESGLYFGFWGSNVDFPDYGDTGIETDWYVGYGWGDENVAFDAGATVYKYVGLDSRNIDGGKVDYDYSEFYFGVTFAENLTLKAFYTSDYANGGSDVIRIKATYSVAINDDWSIPLEFTNWSADAKLDDVDGDYNHFKVGIATSIADFGFELAYVATDFDLGDTYVDGTVISDENEDIYGGEGNFVLTISRDF